MEEIMRQAIELSIQNIGNGGGPFAAIVVKGDKILAEAVNTVAQDNDPTAHAEVNAIRAATKAVGDFHLNDCVLFTTCEPCPMCLGAIYWAGISRVYYANSREDAARYGFQDDHIYHELEKPIGGRSLKFDRMMASEAIEAFRLWDQKSDKILY